MNFLKTRQRLSRGVTLICNRVANLDVGSRLDISDEITDIARAQPRLHEHLWCEYADFLDLVARAVAHQFNRVIELHRSRKNADVTDHAAINIEHGIQHQ